MNSLITDQIFNFFAVYIQPLLRLLCEIRLLFQRVTKMADGKLHIFVHIPKLEARLGRMHLIDPKLGKFGDSTGSHLQFKPLGVD
jgi:hypothetical protein